MAYSGLERSYRKYQSQSTASLSDEKQSSGSRVCLERDQKEENLLLWVAVFMRLINNLLV